MNRIGTAVSHIDETFDVTNTLLLQDQFGTIVGNGTEPTGLPTYMATWHHPLPHRSTREIRKRKGNVIRFICQSPE